MRIPSRNIDTYAGKSKRSHLLKERIGQKFGYLSIISPPYRLNKKTMYQCKCICGDIRPVASSHILDGHTTSCGCMKTKTISENLIKHGHTASGKRTRAYAAWNSMKQRCFNGNAPSYKNYGGRGISVCKEWKESFEAFLSNMGEPPKGRSLDRIDNEGHYSPVNCRWALPSEQANNRRPRACKRNP